MHASTVDMVVLPNYSVRIMRDLLLEVGLDAEQVFAGARVDAALADRPGGVVSARQQLAVETAFVQATEGRRDLWFEAGWRLSPLTHGLLGLVTLTAPNFERWVEFVCQRLDYSYSLAELRRVAGDGSTIGYELVVENVPPDLRSFTVHRTLGSSMRAFRDAWGGTPPIRIEVPASVSDAGWKRPVPITITKTNRDTVRYLRSTDGAGEPLPSSNELLHEMLSQRHESLHKSLAARTPVVERVISLLVSTGKFALPVSAAARALAMSQRTLQRRLAEHGISYREVQQVARAREARRLLGCEDISVSEIAWQLGYIDAPSFSNAFKVWTGLSPTEWRQIRPGTDVSLDVTMQLGGDFQPTERFTALRGTVPRTW
jgi:AraC-like DNA-binding protein